MSQAQEEEDIEEVEEIEEIEDIEVFDEQSGDSSELYRLILICCLGASLFMLLFFCFKIHVENKIKNAPVEDLGPFGVTPPGALKTIAISDLTQDQRKAVLEVLYPDGTCAVFQKSEETETEEKISNDNIVDSVDEECPPIRQGGREIHSDQFIQVPSALQVPSLSMSEDEVVSTLRKSLMKLPALKRRPTFAPIPTQSESEDEEMNIQCMADQEVKEKEVNTTVPKYIVTEKTLQCDDDVDGEGNVCPICIDCYEDGDEIIKSKYCLHYFHKDCILQWLEKHNCCPCCRVEMISNDDLAEAISTVLSKHGIKRVIQIKSEIIEITPPSSPMSSEGSSPVSL